MQRAFLLALQLIVPPQDSIALVDVHLVPLDRERVIAGQTVLVRGGRIIRVGQRDSVPLPSGWRRVEGRGRYVLPGLSDLHTHVRYDGDLALYIAGGVTTVRNMRGGVEHLRWRGETESGARIGPRVITSGPTFYGRGPATRQEADSAVSAQKADGYDGIKVYDDLSVAAYGSLADAARRVSLPIWGHIPRTVGVSGALAQHKTIEHIEQFLYRGFGNDIDMAALPLLVQEIAASGVAVTPTLEIAANFIQLVDARDSLFQRPELKYVHPETTTFWHSQSRNASDENKLLLWFQTRLVLQLANAGVPLLAGTDVYLIGAVPGFSLNRELEHMQRIGLSPLQVLQSATTNGKAAWRSDAGESIAPGARADLILVRDNPLEDVARVRNPDGVLANGRWYDRAALDAILNQVEIRYSSGNRIAQAALTGSPAAAAAEIARSRSDLVEPGLLSYVASVATEQKRYSAASAVLNAALARFPDAAALHARLGDLRAAQKNAPAARAAYQRALQIEPQNQRARQGLEKVRGR